MNKKIFSLFLAVVMLAALVSGCAPVPTQAPRRRSYRGSCW